MCEDLSGTCVVDVEGFYIVNTLSVFFGVIIFWYLRRVLKETENIDFAQWKFQNNNEVDLSGNIFYISFYLNEKFY